MTDDPIRLGDPFPPDALKSFTGRGGKTFTYVEDESVMDRLDSADEVLHWSWSVEMLTDLVVKGRLTITWVEGGESTYEDFGYCQNDANKDGVEPLKEAATDAFRRVARMPGVARYVYAGKAPAPRAHTPVAGNADRPEAARAGAPTRAIAGSSPAASDVPTAEWAEADFEAPQCPVHHKPMRHNAKGWYCPTKIGQGPKDWCQETAA